MKKKILSVLIVTFILLPCLLLTGCFGGSNNIDLRVENGYIQYTTNGTEWENLVELDDLKGSQGVAGREVEFQKTSTHIQWRYKTSNNSDAWKNLVALNDIKGEDLTAEEVTVTYNFNLGESSYSSVNNGILSVFEREGFNVVESKVNEDDTLSLKLSQQSTKGDYFDLYDMKSLGLSNYFLGWYYEDIKVNNLNIVAKDIELTAKWTEDIAKICTTDLFGQEFYNLNSEAKTAWCRPAQSNVQLAPKELYLANGIFYTVEGISITTSTNFNSLEPDAEEVCLPDSITDKNLYYMFEFYASSYSHTVFRSYNCISSDSQTSDISVYQVRNYAFIQHDRIQFVYKINFECNEATLVSTHCYGNGRILYGNYVYQIDEKFNVYNENGNLVTITITKLNDSWMNIGYNSLLEETYESRKDKTTTFNFIIGETVGYIGTVETGQLPSSYKEALDLGYYEDGLCKLVVNYFVKNTNEADVSLEYEDDLIYPMNIVYFYVENEEDVPQDGGNYWHYDTDGETPIIWGSAN